MALPVLDGNQSATTLSSVVTGGEHIVAHSVVCLGSTAIANITNAVSGSVVSISNFPSTQTVTGTVTANSSYEFEAGGSGQPNNAIQIGYYKGSVFEPVTEDDPLPISGTVTANVPLVDATLVGGVTQGIPVYLAGGKDGVVIDEINYINNIPAISGTVTANVQSLPIIFSGANVGTLGSGNFITDSGGPANDLGIGIAYNTDITDPTLAAVVSETAPLPVQVLGGSVTIGSLPAISGTVTANNPSGALTTRFGSVTTANTAQITSAVTKTSRKYLLAQNISAGTVTIGIGFSPTTTQGIQLPAGGGLTFDAFCPTGAVYWLGAVTGAAFTILEG